MRERVLHRDEVTISDDDVVVSSHFPVGSFYSGHKFRPHGGYNVLGVSGDWPTQDACRMRQL